MYDAVEHLGQSAARSRSPRSMRTACVCVWSVEFVHCTCSCTYRVLAYTHAKKSRGVPAVPGAHIAHKGTYGFNAKYGLP
jgi:hypothetical protein